METDYSNIVTKDQLRAILDQTPDTQENQNLIRMILDTLAKQTIDARPYTYNIAYWLAGAFNALPVAAANVILTLPIQADADFLIINQTYAANTANAARLDATLPVPNIVLVLSETASSANMMDQAVPVENIFGTAQQPYILPVPKLLRASSLLQCSASNLDPAVGFNLRLSFNGIKLFKAG